MSTTERSNEAVLEYIALVDQYAALRDELNSRLGEAYLGLARCRYNGIDMSADRYMARIEPSYTLEAAMDGLKRAGKVEDAMEKLGIGEKATKTKAKRSFLKSFESWPSQELKKTGKSFEAVVDIVAKLAVVSRDLYRTAQAVEDARSKRREMEVAA